jgi:uncharacterized membrane protein
MTIQELLNAASHFHPAIIHFPIALVLTGMALEFWRTLRRAGPSRTAWLLLGLGGLAGVAAAATGLLLFHPGDFQERTRLAAQVHRALGLGTVVLVAWTWSLGCAGGFPPRGTRLLLYRVSYVGAALVVGLTGHYGGWIVFGWGTIWAS